MCVAGSSSQYWRRSLPERSARLPAETNVEMPRPRFFAVASGAVPSAPDWLKSPSVPGSGRNGASEALSRTSGASLTIPNEFGPMSRIPYAREVATTCRRLGAGASGLGEARGDDEDGLGAVGRALLDHLGDGVGGHRDDGEVGGARQIAEAGVRGHARDLVRFGVDDPELAGEMG